MSKKNVCKACNALKNGIKTRIAIKHTGCEFDRTTVPLETGGTATFIGKPSKEDIQAVNEMVRLAKERFDKGKP